MIYSSLKKEEKTRSSCNYQIGAERPLHLYVCTYLSCFVAAVSALKNQVVDTIRRNCHFTMGQTQASYEDSKVHISKDLFYFHTSFNFYQQISYQFFNRCDALQEAVGRIHYYTTCTANTLVLFCIPRFALLVFLTHFCNITARYDEKQLF